MEKKKLKKQKLQETCLEMLQQCVLKDMLVMVVWDVTRPFGHPSVLVVSHLPLQMLKWSFVLFNLLIPVGKIGEPLGNIGEESYFWGMLRCTLPATNSSSPLKMGAPWNQKEIPNLETFIVRFELLVLGCVGLQKILAMKRHMNQCLHKFGKTLICFLEVL